MTLKDLEPGDIFVHLKSKSKTPTRYIVSGQPFFNLGHGSPTRMCRKLCGEWVSKSCKLEVKKVGESAHKAKLIEKYCQKPTNE